MEFVLPIIPIVLAWLLDLAIGDPSWLPHPVEGMGKCISFCERHFNKGKHRVAKGAVCAVALASATALIMWLLLRFTSQWIWADILVKTILIFFCLAGTTLIREVVEVFKAADRSLDEGRKQVSRIVGRDTAALSDKEVRAAALETLAENLSDGVIAPLFWLMIAGIPGMMTYKIINTMDSMIGYRNERYLEFGRWAARLDDIVNFIPARLTAALMIVVSGKWDLWGFVAKYGKMHLSPNSGYPEAALAGILNCRFGGPHDYFGELVVKPYIGTNERDFDYQDVKTAVKINRLSEVAMVLIVLVFRLLA
ncbi:MAG: cobalamin biosynthesis protein CobD [Bacteroidales bacterium]|nr:cobalamin biosynthesis protein CobD [Bacteroidales bacterium]